VVRSVGGTVSCRIPASTSLASDRTKPDNVTTPNLAAVPFATLSWRAYAGISDRETAKGLSDDVGTFGALASSEGDNRGTSARGLELGSRSTGENTSTHEISRHLIKASELMEARADELFVIRKSGPPIRCGQAPYFRRPALVSLVKDNRFHRAAAE